MTYVPLVRDLAAPVPRPGRPGLKDVFEAAAIASGMRPQYLARMRRFREDGHARMVYYTLARRMGYSYPQIGDALGVNHTSVLHGVRVARHKHPNLAQTCAKAVAYLSTKFPEWRMLTLRADYWGLNPLGQDWTVYFEELAPDGPAATGRTEKEALKELLWMTDDNPDANAAVTARLRQLCCRKETSQ